MSGLVAAATIGIVLLFFTGLLRFVPSAALGAILVKAGLSLIDLKSLKQLLHIEWQEFALSLVATLGVVAIGAIQGILFVVILAILRFVRIVARPKMEILGKVEGMPGFHAVDRHQNVATTPGLLILRFNAPIVFFNASYFKRELLIAAGSTSPPLKWIILDLLPITMIDATGLETAMVLADELQERGVALVAAGRSTEWRLWTEARHISDKERKVRVYPTLNSAIRACMEESGTVSP